MPLNRLRVLTADDAETNRELVQLFLDQSQYDVELVVDGAAAVLAAVGRPHDLILMDIMMPEMDGLQATRAIRAKGGVFAQVPIVAMSADQRPEQVRRCLAAGMCAFLPKPFSPDALINTIHYWTRGRPSRLNPVLDGLLAWVGAVRVQAFLAALIDQLEAIAGVSYEDTAGLLVGVSALRSAAQALGFDDLAATCGDIETCSGGGWPAMSVQEACSALAAHRTALANALEGVRTASITPSPDRLRGNGIGQCTQHADAGGLS